MSIPVKCPKCAKSLKTKPDAHGKSVACPYCKATIEIRIPYGLSFNNPVLCGGGPPGENAYLNRLICPTGTTLQFKRGGSSVATDKSFLQEPDVTFSPGETAEQTGATDDFVTEALHIDGYEGTCGCGKHTALVWLDMYHRGPERIVELPGWALLRSKDQRSIMPYGLAGTGGDFDHWLQCTCGVCARVYSRDTDHCVLRCEACGFVFCPKHLASTRDNPKAFDACPRGHKDVKVYQTHSAGTDVNGLQYHNHTPNTPIIHLGDLSTCEYSSRHMGNNTRKEPNNVPFCRAQGNTTVSPETWFDHCLQGGTKCPSNPKRGRKGKRWWKFW